ncbi:MAG TPA: group II truncated hemoglobin [Burkholderiales bacterium]|nr:group II truncated hemoglobin [Burkholderiales bacterium]
MSKQVMPYELLGGEQVLFRLVERFYALMDSEPEFYAVRKLHPEDLSGSRDKLFMFLSGWLGGPPLYAEKIGHPMLRARHLPFSIGKAERDAWLACMGRALEDTGVEEGLREWLLQQFFGTADWMRNQPGDMPRQA